MRGTNWDRVVVVAVVSFADVEQAVKRLCLLAALALCRGDEQGAAKRVALDLAVEQRGGGARGAGGGAAGGGGDRHRHHPPRHGFFNCGWWL